MNNQINRSDAYSSGIQSHVIGHNSKEPFSIGVHMELTMETINANKFTFEQSQIRIIILKGQLEFEKHLCLFVCFSHFLPLKWIGGLESTH